MTVLAAVLIVVLTTVMLGGVRLGSAVVARHRAQSVADLAALAAAAQLPVGADAACRTARTLASAMRTTVRGCDIAQLDVVVTINATVGGWVGAQAQAAARAGPR